MEEGMKAKRKQLLEEQAAACEGTVVRKTKAAMLMEKDFAGRAENTFFILVRFWVF